jgi:hypothetical protein
MNEKVDAERSNAFKAGIICRLGLQKYIIVIILTDGAKYWITNLNEIKGKRVL